MRAGLSLTQKAVVVGACVVVGIVIAALVFTLAVSRDVPIVIALLLAMMGIPFGFLIVSIVLRIGLGLTGRWPLGDE